ncbi:MAG: hypothetical protein ACLTBV_13135 [Enterocloster bolteae]
MTSVAAGLAQTGKIPFTNSFAVLPEEGLLTRYGGAIAIGKLNVTSMRRFFRPLGFWGWCYTSVCGRYGHI